MDFNEHSMLTAAQRKVRVRWPDEGLYAMALYIYSLQTKAWVDYIPVPKRLSRGAATFTKTSVLPVTVS